ncbi:hypothetical protein BC830DRAFT_1223748 [Chytriomyces sp. MP71]|nr:hypothetical protein BC830DRAFT_1223748 [Chytriomyces sp. MP71]
MTAAECAIINSVFPTIFTNSAPGCCSLYPQQLTCNAQGNIISMYRAPFFSFRVCILTTQLNAFTAASLETSVHPSRPCQITATSLRVSLALKPCKFRFRLAFIMTFDNSGRWPDPCRKINKFKLNNCKLVNNLFNLPLTILDLSDNGLTGSIPTSVGSFAGDTLDLSKNSFEGTIPDAILNSASTVSLAENSLTGPLPTWPKNYRTTVLDVSYNYITGMIPVTYLSKLTDLDITSNFLYGPAPTVSKKHTLERDENCFDDQTLKSKKFPRNSDCCDSGNLGDDSNCGDCGIACKKKSFCLNNDRCGKKPKAL